MAIAVGVDLGGTQIKAGLVNRDGEVIARMVMPTEADKGREKVLDNMLRSVQELLPRSPEPPKGIGIGSPGAIDWRSGVVLFMTPNIPNWTGTPIKEYFESILHIPTLVDNDANVNALGEYLWGAGAGLKNIVCFTLGTGVGGGIISDGHIYHGGRGFAGELGHITVEIDGVACNCGGKGCVEAYASANAMARYAQQRLLAGDKSILSDMVNGNIEAITSKIIHEAALRGDELAETVIRRAGRYLGAAAANVTNTLATERIIIGGGASAMGDMLFQYVREVMSYQVYKSPTGQTDVVGAKLGADAGMLGAAALVFVEGIK